MLRFGKRELQPVPRAKERKLCNQALEQPPLGGQAGTPVWSFLGATRLPCQRSGPGKGPEGEDGSDKRKNPEVIAIKRAIKMLLT